MGYNNCEKDPILTGIKTVFLRFSHKVNIVYLHAKHATLYSNASSFFFTIQFHSMIMRLTSPIIQNPCSNAVISAQQI